MKSRFFTIVLALGGLALLASAIALWRGLSPHVLPGHPAAPVRATPPGTAGSLPRAAESLPRMIGNSALSHGGPAPGGAVTPGSLRRDDGQAPAATDQGAER